ncbi:MAG: sigma-54 interaction domain-containing protein [bacterium]
MPFNVLFFGNSQKLSLFNGFTQAGPKSVLLTQNKAEALSMLAQDTPEVVVVDFDECALRPLEFVSDVLQKTREVRVIGLADTSPLSLVVAAVKMGVHEVINAREEPHKLRQSLAQILEQWQELEKGQQLHLNRKERFEFRTILGNSPEIQRIFEIITKITRRKWVTVLIRGETGTGKELIAQAIHYASFKQYQPFVEINCNALPENLLESELFGYEKGAFTDAKTQKKGLFELAQNGTLFLDEIGDTSPKVQVKLLKALETKKIRRLGGTRDIQIDTRIIGATNRDLQAAIREGQFRNDLYYRLNVVSIQLPPLRERGEDVILLARHFLSQYAKEYESPLRDFTPEAVSLLRDYSWPGNVRELQHTIERVVLLSDEKIVSPDSLEDAIESDTPLALSVKKRATSVNIDIPSEGISLEEGEKKLIQAVLEKMAWNKRRTCQILKISRPRLDRKIAKFGLSPLQQLDK